VARAARLTCAAWRHLLPAGALMAGVGLSAAAWAQTPAPAAPAASSAAPATTGIGKGNQELRDIPQSVTVVTEKLIDDRNLDT
jgi:catecholate siderophore receptor